MNEREKWLEWRHLGIGSSDSAAIHQESPYMTRYELGQQKLKKEYTEIPSNWAMQKGNDLEPIARKEFAALYNIENNTNETFEPKLVQMADYEFMRASLDGCSEDGNVIIEIKYQGRENHEASSKGIIPRNYFIQMQHQLLVSGAELCHFVSFDGKTMHTQKVFPDLEFMKKHIELCTDFWDAVKQGKQQLIGPKDFKPLVGCEDKLKRWRMLKQVTDEFFAEMDELKAEIIPYIDHPRVSGCGVRITKYNGTRGTVDYAKAIKELKIDADFEPYRRADSKPFYKMEIDD